MNKLIDVKLLLDQGSGVVPVARDAEQRLSLHFEAPVGGLYQLSVIVDASAFDWEELYVNLDLHHNKGQRTGPWDFSLLNKNVPLVPSYWVELNGQKLGLWFFQRVSMEDMAARRFRGRMAFDVRKAGVQELRLTPYRPMTIRWLSATLEQDPEDVLQPVVADLTGWSDRCPAAAWAKPAFWAALHTKLESTHSLYKEPLRRTFGWVRGKISSLPQEEAGELLDFFKCGLNPDDLLFLLALHHLEGDPAALRMALVAVDTAVALEHWGNQKEDGYSHDGDMGAANYMRALAWAYHSLKDHLGDERRERLLAKLRLQGERFYGLTLLNRDYWGGSVIQDHGWRSQSSFATAAIHLLGVFPEAERWVAYAIPRVQRGIEAMSTDGAIPPSSYCFLFAYIDDLMYFREALLGLTDRDLFIAPQFEKIIGHMVTVVREKELSMITSPYGTVPAYGANGFLNIMAKTHQDGRAARLQKIALEVPEFAFTHGTQEQAYYLGTIWGLLTYDPAVAPAASLPPKSPLAVYLDSGMVHYHDPQADVTLSLRCGPWCGHTSYRKAKGPCDRMDMMHGLGHFILALGNQTVLSTPDGGYRLSSSTRSLMLVDGRGPVGDIGYPMSIPSFHYRGEEIERAYWDESTGTGVVRLNLCPAYPDALDMLRYTREFFLHPGQDIVCRDTVLFGSPHTLDWHFHGDRAEGVALVGPSIGEIGRKPLVRIEAKPLDIHIKAGVHETEVVYSYSSAFKKYSHVRFSATEPVTAATVDFVMTWKK